MSGTVVAVMVEAGRQGRQGRAADDPRGDEDGAHDHRAGGRRRGGGQLPRRRSREGRRRPGRHRRAREAATIRQRLDARSCCRCPARDADSWRAALAAALPDAAIAVWPDAPAEPDYALVWQPPAELFARVRAAKAIFNLGAGVDALLAVPTLPRDVPVIRLEDAGMAEQMAEYVTLAALRAYREMDAYAAQQRDGRWQPRHAPREGGVRRRHPGLRRARTGGRRGARAVRLSARGLEPHAQGDRRRRRASPEPASCARSSQRRSARLRCCRRRRRPRPPRSRALVATAARRPRRQRRARRPRRRRRPARAARRGHLAGATLDVFRNEPLPVGPSVLASSADHA